MAIGRVIYRRPAFATTTGTANQIGIDLECVHIQRHIEHGVREHQELFLGLSVFLQPDTSA